ncbi:MAG: TatD family hydrolase [Campylobacteraceae bacterium]|nr:TatD family hydrolase [Campylobacteraceae bacterium]
MIIDTHTHLDNAKFYDDVDEVIQTAINDGVKAFIIPGADLNDLPRAVALSEQYDNIFFAVGVHPYDIDNFDISIMEKYVNHPKCVAVGECGLDYYRLPDEEQAREENISLQKEVFIEQIEFAKKVNKPLIVHIRDASCDSKTILLENNASEVGGVLHCYNADEQLISLSNEGFYFGIGGVITFKNAKKLINVFPKIPLDKLLIETDAPYLTPHPHRGERNEPKFTTHISQKIAELIDISDNDVKNLTTNNAIKLFNVPL